MANATDTVQETTALLQSLQSSLKHIQNPKPQPVYKETALEMVRTPTPTTEPTPTNEPSAPTLPTTTADTPPVPFELWETLAYDLALENNSELAIASAYEISIDRLQELKANSYFAKVLQAKKDEVKQLGSDATFAVKMRMVANRATPQLLARLTNPNTSGRDFIALFRTVTELGQLIPQPTADDQPQPALIGASVTFNIQGVPGLDHLVQATPTPLPTDNVAEAEWSEITHKQSAKMYGAGTADDNELGEL